MSAQKVSALAWVKAKLEKPERLYIFMDDPEAKAILIAWTVIGSIDSAVDHLKVAEDSPDSDVPEVLAELWSFRAEWDSPNGAAMGRLTTLAGIPQTRGAAIFHRMREAGILFPDGTIMRAAHNLITAEVRDHLIGLRRLGRTAPGGPA